MTPSITSALSRDFGFTDPPFCDLSSEISHESVKGLIKNNDFVFNFFCNAIFLNSERSWQLL